MKYGTLVSVEVLLARLEDPAWLLVDCRFDLDQPDAGRLAYLKGHIPGAVYVDLERDLCGPRTGSNGRHPLPTVEALCRLFSRCGVRDDIQVVAYDDFGGAFAARLWWSLRYLGHDAVAVLDGGIPYWISQGLPVLAGEERRAATAFRASPRPIMLASAEEISCSLGAADLLLLDARAASRFRGEEENRDPIAGRIPGSRNRYWGDNILPDNRLRPVGEIKAGFERALAGIAPEKVVVYCGSGVTACHNLLMMEHVGFSGARLYAGSWSEWIVDPQHPVATGEPSSSGDTT